ncbi:TIGR03899 family protein [Nitrosospira sp. Nsp14]|uniref:DUF2806 domain-containing protein n=1 Tax=Nitrosospira sp. Nsp14 TaxID=1855333 RepID=UPI0008F079A2|nr:DUF2806 domain-containing protein [Nitrosospira sp. Nsp14]SFH13579.1 TIGR03899 family protein [Nitrosospira sp. Nsp14]
MEIKDLAGLSQPLTRLIEVISNGIGAVSRPYLIRRNADAKAYEVRTISSALINIADQHHLPVVFKDGEFEIWQKPDDQTLTLQAPSNEDRANSRSNYQERKRQRNIENITSVAAADLLAQSSVPDQKPDEDWVSRFFNSAQDVSSQQMQELWGRILSGEIKKPGSYSLKTLDFVKNLTKADATLLENMAKLAINYQGSSFIVAADAGWLRTYREIYPGHHFALGELGAMYPTELGLETFRESSVQEELFTSGNLILAAQRGKIATKVDLAIWKFTKIGQEVLQLIAVEGDEAYLEKVGGFYIARNGTATMGRILEYLPTGQIRYQPLREITPA